MEYFEIIIATIFVNNILLAQFLGNCPFLGTSKKMETAMGMAMAVIFVLVMAGVITWLIYSSCWNPTIWSTCGPSPSSW
jgi:electron transport complex protein RnfA